MPWIKYDAPALGMLRGGASQRRADALWNVDGNESGGWIQVVFATLVDDAKITSGACVMVWQSAIDIVQIQRNRITVVVDADNVLEVSVCEFMVSPNNVCVSPRADRLRTGELVLHLHIAIQL